MKMEEFDDFGAPDLKMSQDINLEHAFKAEKVTFRDVSRLFAEIAISRLKRTFLWKSGFGTEFRTFWAKSALFRLWAPKTRPECLCL